MKNNFYEAELRKNLRMKIESNCIREVGDSTQFFAQLIKAYPVKGSRIDWSLVPGSIEKFVEEKAFKMDQFVNFFDEVVDNFCLSGSVIYVGDSATDFAIAGSLACVRQVVLNLLDIPQHHYFIGPSASWCICFTMEGDMGFGFHPSSTKTH